MRVKGHTRMKGLGRSSIVSGVVAALGATALLLGALTTAANAEEATLGSTSGVPTGSICAATVRCTYIPFNGIQFLVAPSDGTITSFSLNAAAASGPVELRVLSSPTPPAFLNDQWTGAGTSPPETLKEGLNTFAVDLPVKKGDTIALDDESGAPVFDTTSPFAKYAAVSEYAPAIPDGLTAWANRVQYEYGLLMSVSMVLTPAPVTTGPTGPAITPTTTQTPAGAPPRIENAFEVHRLWREAPARARARRVPLGTSFGVVLDQAATVTIAFTHQEPGRMSGATCEAFDANNSHGARCSRAVAAGRVVFAGHAGLNVTPFAGRTARGTLLSPGRYVATILARNASGQSSDASGLPFEIFEH